MRITVSEPPMHDGLEERVCYKCGEDILLLRTVGGAKIVLDARPGPYRLEEQEDGIIRAANRGAIDGYTFHFDNEGDCGKAESPEVPEEKFVKLNRELGLKQPC